MCTMRVRVPNT